MFSKPFFCSCSCPQHTHENATLCGEKTLHKDSDCSAIPDARCANGKIGELQVRGCATSQECHLSTVSCCETDLCNGSAPLVPLCSCCCLLRRFQPVPLKLQQHLPETEDSENSFNVFTLYLQKVFPDGGFGAQLSSLSVSGRSSPSDPVYLLDLSLAPPPGDAVIVSCSDFTLHVHDKQTCDFYRPTTDTKAPLPPSDPSQMHRHFLLRVTRWHRSPRPDSLFFQFRCELRRFASVRRDGAGKRRGQFSGVLGLEETRRKFIRVYSESHSDDITQVLFHPTDKDRLASGSTDGLVNVFDLTKGAEEDALVGTCNSESSVSALCWLGRQVQGRQERQGHSRLLCVSHDEGLKLWDLDSLDTEEELTVYSSDDARTQSHATTARESGKAFTGFSDSAVDYLVGGCWLESEQQLLVVGGSGGGDVHLFTCDKPGLNLVRTLRTGHRSTVRCFGFDSQSLSLFTGGEDGVLLRWSPEESSTGAVADPESGAAEKSRGNTRL
ncbi:hypothetical protein WMY93_016546 [Mugilogobius chulae]|uniref:WD repeat-containing protein 89 n=1 Tax=Mugilogobius chulae TaxID=88201 RepID=A0AAW0NS71_9GOBI